jgi:hypothetical protein
MRGETYIETSVTSLVNTWRAHHGIELLGSNENIWLCKLSKQKCHLLPTIETHDDGKEQGSRNVSEHVEREAADMSAMKTTSEVDQIENTKELGGTGIWSP